ncbi:MAG: protein translocase subunit SecD [Candidatus Magasanikbacteria bacterium]|uniref:Protein translocase subunit SecD n=1 Tax=Candidatus Magasanikbacteria bacterium CG10_big_fil_rev_8_21_14_0_10_38_6 TaxID=1974647 RepID=A0A2M6P2G7_9BACT|nr:protein translocase subunit SecD [Candidatus Magasanikbacteria bacterium]NCS71663.1 protein translocase subunit SecD [Candidatus Magasanikbacteria bacterium]PIR77749.1 MAG: protein translocase subunit SecD [Candidatus Magasanikbacteria bacterium CG10_big_fil_rev_8_21_14_0_10_38_6]
MAKSTQKDLRSKIRWGIVGILVLLLVTIAFDAPTQINNGIQKFNTATGIGLPHVPEKLFSLGLDLQGGAHLVYEADVKNIESKEQVDAVEGVRDVIERRINALGVGEPSIHTAKVGDVYRINVDLPGVTDVNEAISRIGETPILEFREQNTEQPRELTEEEQAQIDQYNKDAKEKIDNIKKEIDEGLSFEDGVLTYSEDTASNINNGSLGFVAPSQLTPELSDWAKNAKEGDLSDVVNLSGGYHIFKRGGEQPGEKEVRASHILICYTGATRCNSDKYSKQEALDKAKELFDQANAENFADLAKEFSTEPGADKSAGDLGFFREGQMVSAFNDAVFNVQIGQILGPVETEFGYHIIYKTEEQIVPNIELSHIFIKTETKEDILPTPEEFVPTTLSGKQLERAQVVTNSQTGEVQVSLQFDAEGRAIFASLTEKYIGKPIAIYLDGEPISIPVVQTIITDGQAVITGGFDIQEAKLLAQRLNAGALPVPVELVGQQTVGATLGAESLAKSLKAGAIALVLVMIYMIIYYRLPGILSVIALGLYMSLTLAIFKLVGVTITLAGIAGFILSIGMAVDANVLIFERLKEEIKKGKSLETAVEQGFERAWSAIKDGNISTIITCILLIWLGSSFVQGFAFTLAIGILVSMFSAITVTRVMLRFVSPWFNEQKQKLFFGITKK